MGSCTAPCSNETLPTLQISKEPLNQISLKKSPPQMASEDKNQAAVVPLFVTSSKTLMHSKSKSLKVDTPNATDTTFSPDRGQLLKNINEYSTYSNFKQEMAKASLLQTQFNSPQSLAKPQENERFFLVPVSNSPIAIKVPELDIIENSSIFRRRGMSQGSPTS